MRNSFSTPSEFSKPFIFDIPRIETNGKPTAIRRINNFLCNDAIDILDNDATHARFVNSFRSIRGLHFFVNISDMNGHGVFGHH